jgi:hypothetical protein
VLASLELLLLWAAGALGALASGMFTGAGAETAEILIEDIPGRYPWKISLGSLRPTVTRRRQMLYESELQNLIPSGLLRPDGEWEPPRSA